MAEVAFRMKSEVEIKKRLKTLEDWCARANNGSDREIALMSAIDELEWVLQKR